jgi:hypothetical protein
MKLSETAISGPLYSIIAVYLPLSVVAILLPLASAILSLFLPSLVFPFPALLVPALLSGLAASLYYSLQKHSQTSHAAANIRGAVVVMALSYGIASLLWGGLPLGRRFFPNPANVCAPLIGLYVWALVLVTKEMFRARERLEAYTAAYSGDKLRQEMLDDSNLLSSADRLIVKTRWIYLFQLILLTAITLTCLILKAPLSLGFFIPLVFVMVMAALLCGLLGLFRREHYFAGEGIAASVSDRSRLLLGMLLFSLVAAGGAILLSLGRSLLPLSLITGFFAWLASLFTPAPRRLTEMEFLPQEVPAEPLGMVDIGALLGYTEPAEPWPVWKWLQYGAIGLAVLGFLWFMVRPLLFRETGDGRLPLGKKLFLLIAEWLRNLRVLGRQFLQSLRGGPSVRLAKPDDAQLRRMSSELLAAYSPKKRREMRQSATLFARLIIWGSQIQQVTWKPAYAPGEYCARLAAALPAVDAAVAGLPHPGRAILRCGELFERSLYAAAVLSSTERREFKGLVDKITAPS